MSADTCCNSSIDDVILPSNIINLDKNCIKYREKSYKKFLTRPLSVPTNLNLTKRLTTVLRQTSHDESRKVQQVDLDIIRKLEEEIYKKREMVYLNYDANKAAGSTNTKAVQRTEPSSQAEKNIIFNRSICPHITTTSANQKPVLYLDAEKFEPILLRNDRSDTENISQNNNQNQNHSVVVIDNSKYYPVIMRYDVNEEHFEKRQQKTAIDSKNTENENTATENGSTSIKFKRFLFNRNSFSFRFKNKRRRKQQQSQQYPQDKEEVAPLQRSNSENSIAHAQNEDTLLHLHPMRIPVYQAFSEPDLNEETATTTTTLTATTTTTASSSSTSTTTTNNSRRSHLQQNRFDLILRNPNDATQICFVKNSGAKKRNPRNSSSNKYVARNSNNVLLRHSTGPSTSAVKTWIYRRR